MNPLDAAYHVVHEYPGGAPAVAARLGKPVSTLNQELRPPRGCNAKLGLLTAVSITDLTGDLRILHAWADQAHCRVVYLGAPQDAGSADLMGAMSAFVKETSEALTAMSAVLEDGRITEREICDFEKQAADIAPKAARLAELFRAHAHRQALARATPIRSAA